MMCSSGFSLICSILLAVTCFLVSCNRNHSGVTDPINEDLCGIYSALWSYSVREGKNPETTEEIARAFGGDGPIDGNGRPYRILYAGNGEYSVVYVGKDGRVGTGDDKVVNFMVPKDKDTPPTYPYWKNGK